MTGTVGRYAPSPTGPLHLGNLRTALLCWLHARAGVGRLRVRMDDLDTPRNRPGAAEGILEDLRWLGLDWDGEVAVQSARGDRYKDAFERLKAAGRAFPCRCSRRDIEMAPSVPDPRFPAPRYPGTCRPENRPAAFSPDEPVAWRFRVADETLEFPDGILGPQRVNLAAYPGDFVIRRKDGIFAYQLASVVDDGLLGVTDVVRGADLADSTARQIALFRSLGYPVPRFWHVPLMTDAEGKKLSKRDGADSLDSLRAQGKSPPEVIGMLGSSLGLCPAGVRLDAHGLLRGLRPDFLRRLAAPA